MNDEVRHFSLRKLSIGLASVLVGVSIFGASQTVKADTVADQNASAVTSNTQSSDTQKMRMLLNQHFQVIIKQITLKVMQHKLKKMSKNRFRLKMFSKILRHKLKTQLIAMIYSKKMLRRAL